MNMVSLPIESFLEGQHEENEVDGVEPERDELELRVQHLRQVHHARGQEEGLLSVLYQEHEAVLTVRPEGGRPEAAPVEGPEPGQVELLGVLVADVNELPEQERLRHQHGQEHVDMPQPYQHKEGSEQLERHDRAAAHLLTVGLFPRLQFLIRRRCIFFR